MGKLKAGLVGLRRGQGLVAALASHPDVEIAALCDINQDTLSDLGKHFNLGDDKLFTEYHEFVNAPLDIVVVATPIEHHAQQAIAAMESGKHVLSEQTAAYTLDDCERLINAVHRTGQKYMMAENYCYFHYVREWQKMIQAGKLGKLFYGEGEYIHEIVDLLIDPKTGKPHWRYTRAPIWYCGHTLGPLLTLMDDRVVKATGVHAGRNKYPNETVAFLDMEVGLFQTEKGAVIKILRSQTAPRYHDMVFYSLYGTEGFVETGREGGWWGTKGRLFIESEMDKSKGAIEYDCPVSDPNAPEEAKHGGHGTSEYYMVRDFVASIQNNTKPPIDVIRSVDMTAPGICAHESAMKGGVWVDVPTF
ncbi:MAG: Gfo/Idh/MocA family protein [Anaerolineae bacterium]